MTLRVLVTGVAGFIGYHVANQLIRNGNAVLGIDSINSYYDQNLKKSRLSMLENLVNFSYEIFDLVDAEKVLEATKKFQPTHIVHLAAQAGVRYSLQNPQAYINANVSGFLSVLEACRAYSVEHLIYASSSSVYGANTKVPFSETDRVEQPVSLYAATKRSNELMAQTYAHLFGIPQSGLRFFTVYGPWGRPDMAYHIFTKAILEGRQIELFNHGRMERDFTYIDDVVEAIVRLLGKPPNSFGMEAAPHIVYNIGNHTPVKLERFIQIISEKTGRSANKVYRPMQLGDVVATYANVDRLMAAVDFAPRTSLEDGLGRFVDWYKDYYRDL
ncbi:NAD-dependent epimerase/dehydratase family protein [Methylobacterium gossipiicola]|uniref:UDP-glucuronate 4-epimerase n=1 Tax=Methylobacterium gossipiicola TaxID=582675 RepID=A0A1I2X7Y7_9HYPH|nr:NAD-dependent epimerase/dehydratase family protein [Methylobacterium gossipiicola]SFH09618.1 UDP-glucuronate 4-epimerase [Methylobacterium gossipiicola]